MGTKAQPQPEGLTPPVSDASSSHPPQALSTGDKSCEAMAVGHEVLRNVDAARLLESVPDAMVLVDGRGRIAVVNGQAEKMFGYGREELVGEAVEKLIPERFPNSHIAHRSGYTAAPCVPPMGADLELHGLRKDGTEFPIEISLSPLETEEGVLISSTIRDISNLKRTQELQAGLEFEKLMSRLSKAFINLPMDRIDGEVSNGLKELAEVLDLDRVNINLFDPDKKSRTITHSWTRPGIPPPPPGKIMNEAFPWVASRIANRKISFVSAPEDLPEEAAAEREYMLSVGVKSWMAIPLQVGGEQIGSIGTSMFRRRQTWDPLLISRFHQAAEIFANALARKHISQNLRESEEQAKLALDAAKLGVWGWTIGSDESWGSKRTWELFGWPANSKLNHARFIKCVHPEDRELVQWLLEQAQRKATPHFSVEFRLLLPDGTVRWIKSLGRCYSGAEGTPDRVMGVSLDITDRKRDEEALSNQFKFETLLADLSATFINLPANQLDGRIKESQKRICEALGLDRSTLCAVSPDFDDVIVTHSWAAEGFAPNPPLSKKDLPWLVRTVLGGQRISFARIDDLPEEAAKDKETFRRIGQKSNVTFPLSAGGRVIGVLAFGSLREERKWPAQLVERLGLVAQIFANALARKRAVEAQSEIEERFRFVADTAPVLIWMSDTNKLCTFFNRGWLDFTGRTMEEESGEGWISGVHPEDLNRCVETYSTNFDARSEFTMEYRLRRYDGEYRWIVDRGVPRFDPSGSFLGYIGSCIDITDRTRAEHALAEQLNFETLLAELSATFINLDANQVDGQIKESQKRICEALGLDRSTLGQVSPEGDGIVVTQSWAADGFEPNPRLSRNDLPWMERTLLGGQRISFARIDDLPEEAAKDKEVFRRIGPKSNVTFPLSAGGKVIGSLAFGSLREEREWPAPLVERLGLVAQVFANALDRAQADKSLHQAYGEIEQLKGRLERENVYLREEVKLEHLHNEVIGDSESIRRVLQKAEQVAPTDSTVLVLGETGTGKELIARTIHEQSRRKGRVMVKVNCAALPASLIESELFGREKGAYTGALTREMGRFELANGSTILLDEVGELPVELQAKLLRVLQEGEFERLGSPKTIKVDVRVIAATSKNLQQAVREGKFREDLFYRLNVFPITIPPLRERREDIPALVWHFVKDLSQRMGRSIETIHSSTMEAFKSYYWPGNVRELRNVIERFLITSTNTVFRADLSSVETPATGAHAQTFEEVERNHILHTMEMVGWRVRGEGGAAQILGVKPTTLESRMQKLGIIRRK